MTFFLSLGWVHNRGADHTDVTLPLPRDPSSPNLLGLGGLDEGGAELLLDALERLHLTPPAAGGAGQSAC